MHRLLEHLQNKFPNAAARVLSHVVRLVQRTATSTKLSFQKFDSESTSEKKGARHGTRGPHNQDDSTESSMRNRNIAHDVRTILRLVCLLVLSFLSDARFHPHWTASLHRREHCFRN